MANRSLRFFLFLLFLHASIAWGNIDFPADDRLESDLTKLEDLYNHSRWEEVIPLARDLMKKAPQGHPIRQRALDLITLSLDRYNRKKLELDNAVAVAEHKKSAELLVSEATTLLGEKNYKDAITRLRRAVNLYGGDAETHFLIGFTQQSAGNPSDAYIAYKDCLRINPDHPRAMFHLAELSFKLKRFDEAEEASNKLSRIMTSRIQELKALGYEQKTAGMNDKALATVRKIAALKRNLAQTNYMLGILLERRERWGEARDAFQASAELNSRPMEVYFHLGQAQFKLGKFHSSQQAFEQSLFIGETLLREEAAKGKKLLDEGKTDEAVAAELKVKTIKKRLSIARYSHAVCSWKRKDNDIAMDSIDKALKFNPDLIQARFAKAFLLANLRDFQSALYEIRRILKNAQPNSIEAKKAIGLVKALMDRSVEDTMGKPLAPPLKPKSGETMVDEYVKDMPGLGGRKTEEEWNQVLPVMREVRELVARQNTPEAIRRVIHLRIQFPDCVQVHSVLGNLYFQEGRLPDAADSYKHALALNPKDPESLSNLSYIYTLRGEKLDKALDMASQAVHLEPTRAEYHHTMGWAWFRIGEVDKAIACIKRALELRPVYPLAYYNLGLAYYLSGNFEQALGAFDVVIAKDPQNDKAPLFKAITLAKMKKGEEAVKVLAGLKKTLPEKETLFKVVENLHDRLKTANERHTEIEMPRIKHFAPIDKLLAKARDYRSKGLVSRAKEIYLECQRLNPAEFAPWYELGAMYAESGLSMPARKAWEQALKINPNSYELQFNIGKMLFRTSERAKAKQAFAKAESLRTNDPEPPYYLGLIAYEEQRFESAESYALQAIRLKARYYKALALLGLSRIRQGRLVQARDAYEIIYEKAPGDSNIRRHARKKLWEIARLMAPDKAPSFANIAREEQYLTQLALAGSEPEKKVASDTMGKKLKPRLDSLTSEEKIFVLKKLQSFENYPEPPAHDEKFPQREAQEKKWVQKRLELFKITKRLYPPPPPSMTSKYKLHAAPPPPRKTDKADEFLKKGVDAAEKGFLDEAREAFEKGREVSPQNLDVLVNLGFLNTLAGNFKDAYDQFYLAVQTYPNEPLPRLALGNLLWLGGKGKEAAEQWGVANGGLKLDPAFNLLARSEKAWKRFLDMNPHDPDGHSNLGIVYLFSQRPTEAIREFNQVLSIDPVRLENRFYQSAAWVHTFLKSKKPDDKKEAKECLMGLATISPPFPHSGALLSFVDGL